MCCCVCAKQLIIALLFLKVKKKIRYTFPSSILKCVIKFVCFVELKTYYYTLFGNTYCAFVKKSAIIFASNVLILLAGSNTEKRRNKLVTILWRYRISFDRRDLATIADFCVSMGLWHIGIDQCSNVAYEYTYLYYHIYLHSSPLFFYEKW